MQLHIAKQTRKLHLTVIQITDTTNKNDGVDMKYLRIVLLLLGAIFFTAAHADLSLALPTSNDYVESNTISTIDLSATATIETPAADYSATAPSTTALPSRINTKNLHSDGSTLENLVSFFKPIKIGDSSVKFSLRKRMVTFSFAF